MKGYRFYLEYPSNAAKRAKRDAYGTVFAVATDLRPFFDKREGAGAVTEEPNAPCCWTSATLDYLRRNCRRISETAARAIHPRLFAYLEDTTP